ncbi:MAG: DEAD/DEAH box helicase [Nitrososphaerota archaeon]|nr:DEAD/DEAH box helicase [Nitrososphaerota archaeon]MDG6930888.1 DEAD/DEAH box helicase [Nitrososphaerota archaeon]
MNTDDLQLPYSVKSRLKEFGYNDLWPPQEEAVRAGILDGANALISTPTASGKTLTAMIAVSKVIIETGLKAVYISPLRALAGEKYFEFKNFFSGITKSDGGEIRVCISTGDYDVNPSYLSSCDLIITTNERFDSIMRHRVKWLERVGLFIFDEIHLLSDESRGATLEFVLTESIAKYSGSQFIALSATVSNCEEIAGWLGFKSVSIDWRPVKLTEGVAYDEKITKYDGSQESIEGRGALLDNIVNRELENGHQVLVFAETRKKAVELAKRLSNISKSHSGIISVKYPEEEEETSISRILQSLISVGTAFHHAGIPTEYRALIEKLFIDGKLKIICSTPTLAAGVNLPAHTVIVNSVYRYNGSRMEPIKIMEYKQMAGRAGRPKFDESGECIVIANSEQQASWIMDNYIRGYPEPISSKLNLKSTELLTLAHISISRLSSEREIDAFFNRTLFAKQFGNVDVRESLDYLKDAGFIRKLKNGKYETTAIGRLVGELYISPSTAKEFIKNIVHIKNEVDLTMPLICLASTSEDIDPKLSLNSSDQAEINSILELEPRLLRYVSQDTYARSLLGLYAWVNEFSEQEILDRYRIDPGDLFRLTDSAEWLMHSYLQLGHMMGLSASKFETAIYRIKYGVKEELIDLVKVEKVGRKRSRALYNAGIKNLDALAAANPQNISQIRSIGPGLATKIVMRARKLVAKRV